MATTSVWMSGAVLLVPVAQAQTAADLQAQIAGLLLQIQQLQAQLSGSTGGGATTSYSFTRSLTIGSTGEDVRALQQFLNSHSALVSSSGAGSPGNESTYFGSKTRAALAKWQAANGVSPAVGYFGPITRAAIAAMAVTTPTPTQPIGTPPPVAGTGLNASLSSNNPVAGSIISSAGAAAARVPVLGVTLSAGTGSAVNVSQIKFKKNGVLSDSSISNAYLLQSGKVVAQYSSISGGVVTFSGMALSIPAGQSLNLVLGIDPATGLSAGNTVSFSLTGSDQISATDAFNNAVTVGGSYPLTGNTFTVTSVSNPALGALTISSSAVGTTVYAGTQNVLVSQWTVNAATNPQNLTSINFRVVGSANKNDIKNVVLKINGSQVGTTLSQVPADGNAFFDLSASTVKLNAGNNNLQVYADVMGSPSFTFQFELLNTYDVASVDTQYNTPVGVTINGGAGVQITINQGQVTMQLATNTPTGNIATGGSQVPLLSASVYAAGEAIKIKWLDFTLAFSGSVGVNLDSAIKNVTLADDAGNQVGSTINSLTTTVTCTTAQVTATTTASNCFGSSGSPITYTIPANTTRVLTLRGDIQSGATFSTIQAAILAGTGSNLQGLTSSQTGNTGAVTGAVLNRSAASVSIAQNSAVGAQTVAKGALGIKIGAYTLTASAAEGANLTSITILTSASSTNFQNLRVCVEGVSGNQGACPSGSAQFGNTQSTLSASASYGFSGALNIPAGQTKNVNVIADVLSGTTAATYTTVTTLSSCSGSGASTLTNLTCSSTAGQNLVVAGQANLNVSLDSNSPKADQIVMGATGLELARFNLNESTNIEAVRIVDLILLDTVGGTSTIKTSFGGLNLYKSSDLNTSLASAGGATGAASTTGSGGGYYYKFHFDTPVVVPQAGTLTLVLKGNVSSYSASGATDNSTHIWKIATTTDSDNDLLGGETVNALGATSQASSSVALLTGANAPSGNTLTVLRSKLSVSAAALGGSAHTKGSTADDLGTLTFAADSAGSVTLNTVTITFSGTAPSIATFLDGVNLIDANGNTVNSTNYSGLTIATSSTACNGTNTCTKSWNFGTTNTGKQITAGSSYQFKLQTDTTKTLAAQANIAQTLSATIASTANVVFYDSTDSSGSSGLTLPTSTSVPIQINSVSFSVGT